MIRLATAGILFFACSASAVEDELFGRPSSFSGTIKTIDPVAAFNEPPQTQPETKKAARFGDKGTMWWTFGGGVANNFSGATDFNLRAALSEFVVRDVEFTMELNGWYFDQPGDDSFGINPAFAFRWHFYNTETWTVFGDVGIGMLLTTDDTPNGGTSVNFTPRIGTGVTYKLADDGTRLQVGLRWHHISNARIEGDFGNPARDGLMVYAGVMIPF